MSRWRQRYENFSRAYLKFQEAISVFPQLSQLEKEGLIQRFEYTFELAWKSLKDYLESQGVVETFPREVIKKSFHHGLIQDGEMWMDMLEARNGMSYNYNEERFNAIIARINSEFFSAITQVYNSLGELL